MYILSLNVFYSLFTDKIPYTIYILCKIENFPSVIAACYTSPAQA